MAVFVNNLTWGWPSACVFFAKRIADKAKELGVPTADLIRRFQSDQPRAFEALYDRFKDYVYRVALFITRDGAAAEDAVQETFLDVLRALPNYRVEGPARFETWLYRVTVNRCRSSLRRKRLPSAEWDEIKERLERIPEPRPNHDPETVTLRRERAVERVGEENAAQCGCAFPPRVTWEARLFLQRQQ